MSQSSRVEIEDVIIKPHSIFLDDEQTLIAKPSTQPPGLALRPSKVSAVIAKKTDIAQTAGQFIFEEDDDILSQVKMPKSASAPPDSDDIAFDVNMPSPGETTTNVAVSYVTPSQEKQSDQFDDVDIDGELSTVLDTEVGANAFASTSASRVVAESRLLSPKKRKRSQFLDEDGSPFRPEEANRRPLKRARRGDRARSTQRSLNVGANATRTATSTASSAGATDQKLTEEQCATLVPLPRRIKVANAKGWDKMSALQRAQILLTLAHVPDRLPCREAEHKRIYDWMHSCIEMRKSGVFYVNGSPGNGKTATVLEVVGEMASLMRDGSLKEFQFVSVNAMTLHDPASLFTKLWREIDSRNAPLKGVKALEALKKHFSVSKKRQPVFCVVLVDEIDQLETKTDTKTLYSLFNLVNNSQSLAVVGISNRYDLPHSLPSKVKSRMQNQQVTFAQYTEEQLETIIKSRLEALDEACGFSVFESDAVLAAAKKIASFHGDARRALEIVRRGASIAENSYRKYEDDDPKKAFTYTCEERERIVRWKHVRQAISSLFNEDVHVCLAQAPPLTLLVLLAILQELRLKGADTIDVESAYERYCVYDHQLRTVRVTKKEKNAAGVEILTPLDYCPWTLSYDEFLRRHCVRLLRLGLVDASLNESGGIDCHSQLEVKVMTDAVVRAARDSKDLFVKEILDKLWK